MIYALRLIDNKYYVGYTERMRGERFAEHFNGVGSRWTQLYKPIELLEWREGTLEDEDRLTLEYMTKYFWQNVRGGRWCCVEMIKPPKELIEGIIDTGIMCSKCGRNTHLVEKCYAKTHLRGYKLAYATKANQYRTTSKVVHNYTIPSDVISPQVGTKVVFSHTLPNSSIHTAHKCRSINISNIDNIVLTSSVLSLENNEILDMVYLYQLPNYKYSPYGGCFVGVTRRNDGKKGRLLNYESFGDLKSIYLNDIIDLKHESNIMLSDRVILSLKDSSEISIYIYTSLSCETFFRYLKEIVNQ
jgi:predicted GIY-YIG superfamily endonuclease